MSDPAVLIEDIRFRYPKGDRPALDGIHLDVRPGERFALLGPNGCGKTTLFRILATLLPLQHGSVRLFGHDLRRERAHVRRLLGIVFQHPSLDGELNALENLTHHGRLYGLGGADLRKRITRAVERFDLADFAHRRTGRLSGGQQRRVELAKAMLHEPRLLLMDEPTSGLDPAGRYNLWRLVDELRQQAGLTVLLTTHLMDEADPCDRVTILDRGRRVALDRPEAIKQQVGRRVVTVQTRPQETEAVTDELRQRFSLTGMHVRNGTIHFETQRGADLVDDIATLLGDRAQRIGIGPPSLDDAFLHLTGHPLDA